MTYIIGARCKDGVVLVGDKKVTFSGDIQKDKYEEKIRTTPQFNDVIFSAAGIKELFEEFLLELPRRVLWGHNAIEEQNKTLPPSLNKVYTISDFKKDCINIWIKKKK